MYITNMSIPITRQNCWLRLILVPFSMNRGDITARQWKKKKKRWQDYFYFPQSHTAEDVKCSLTKKEGAGWNSAPTQAAAFGAPRIKNPVLGSCWGHRRWECALLLLQEGAKGDEKWFVFSSHWLLPTVNANTREEGGTRHPLEGNFWNNLPMGIFAPLPFIAVCVKISLLKPILLLSAQVTHTEQI